MRIYVNGTKMRTYLQKSKKWLDATWNWNSVGFESFGLANKSLPGAQQIATSKMTHGWLNTGRQRKKLEPGSANTCPRCGIEDEAQEHVNTAQHVLSDIIRW